MFYSNYHIQQSFSGKLLYLNVLALEKFSYFKKNFFNFNLKTGLIVWINRDLSNIYVHSEGLKVIIKSFSKEKAILEYKPSEKYLSKYRALYSKLEKVDFFENNDTKELAERLLFNLYEIEAEIRTKAFSDDFNTLETGDKPLLDFASALSLSSMQNIE